MKTLGIDVCTGYCAAAIIDGEAVRASMCEPMQRGHAERLAPMVAELLTASGLTPDDLDGVAVTTGPGSFTGARLGVSFARGLALAASIPAIGVSIFEVIAANAQDLCFIALHGKGEMISVQAFESGKPLMPPLSVPIDTAWRHVPAGPMTLFGAKAEELRAASPELRERGEIGSGDISPEAVARLGAERLAAGAAGLPAPLYLRAPDAKPQAQAAL